MRKILFALLSCMALATVWYGCSKDEDEGEQTGIIYGTVTDFATGEPVGDANVKLKPSGVTIGLFTSAQSEWRVDN